MEQVQSSITLILYVEYFDNIANDPTGLAYNHMKNYVDFLDNVILD